MKALMLPLIAFLTCFAIAGGAGAYVTRPTAAAAAPADSTHADSAAADAAHADAAHADSAHAPTAASPATLTPHAVDGDSASSARDPHGTTAPTPGEHAGSAGATRPSQLSIESLVRSQTGATVTMRADGTIGPERRDSQPDYERMASLLTKMGAREAARTVEQLSSGEAARAVAAMSDKQAAAVLAQLKPEKAAALLQAALSVTPRTTVP